MKFHISLPPVSVFFTVSFSLNTYSSHRLIYIITYLQDGQDGWSPLMSIVGDIQSLLLTIMCAAVKIILSRKLSCSGTSYQVDHLECSCLIDAAIAFCKLQHLDPTISIKTQVCASATFILGKVTELLFFFLFFSRTCSRAMHLCIIERKRRKQSSYKATSLPHLGDERRWQ